MSWEDLGEDILEVFAEASYLGREWFDPNGFSFFRRRVSRLRLPPFRPKRERRATCRGCGVPIAQPRTGRREHCTARCRDSWDRMTMCLLADLSSRRTDMARLQSERRRRR